jgi:primosomal protein N' (replication factor Y) (superfamily II helicase)
MLIKDTFFILICYNTKAKKESIEGILMYAKVVVDIQHSKVDRIFSYRIPKGLEVFVGSRVQIPFGRSNKKIEGYVLGFTNKIDYDPSKLKSIIKTLSKLPEFTQGQLDLALQIKDFYITTLVSALRLMFPSQMRGNKISEKVINYAKLSLTASDLDLAKKSLYSKEGKLKSPVMLGILSALERSEKSVAELTKIYPSASSSIKSMCKKNWVEVYQKSQFRTPLQSDISYENANYAMTTHQQNAISCINAANGQAFLLHGVTGSGKTEVYIKAIEHCIKNEKTAIMLVPEIGLTPQLISMFNTRLGDYIAIYHSSLSAGERYDEWRKINSGQAKVVIGPRSALFVPLKNIGLIILDEEHENTYKADQHPKYKTHEIAKMRAQIENANLVFASATPSVETYYEAQDGNMQILSMPNRINDIDMPDVYIEDMRKELRSGNRTIFSGRLYSEITKALNAKQQIILFINRRGYSSFVMCRGCGHIVRCDDCDVSMTLHKSGELVCHYCGNVKHYSKTCEACGKPFVKLFGIGTQQIEHEVKKTFPNARTLRMDFDTTRIKNAHANIYSEFKKGNADILIGTQLVAKGLDFDNVMLVGALAADVSLHFPDYLAVEKTYSLLQQASGRSGRKSKGTVVIQTYKPEHYAITAAAKHDYSAFYNQEITVRHKANTPPFGVIIRIVFIGESATDTFECAAKVESSLKKTLIDYSDDILLIKSSPAPIKKIRSKSRYHIVIKAKKGKDFLAFKTKLYQDLKEFNFDKVGFGVEINPQSMF